MKSSWQGTLLITDEPSLYSNQIGQVYVLHVQPNGTIHGYCITKPYFWNDSRDWAKRSNLCKQYNISLKSPDGIDPIISNGGDVQNDSAFIIYDASFCWTQDPVAYPSSKTISKDVLCVAKFEDAVDHLNKSKKWPAFETIVNGYTKFSSDEIDINVASGKWQSRSLLAYPFVVYANQMEFKAEVARNVLRAYDGNFLSLMSHTLPMFDELRIAGIKHAALEKAGNDTTADELKEITRMMLYMEASKEDKFFEIKHGDWQEQLSEFRKLNIGGTEFDGLKKKPMVERYEELELAYSKLGFNPRMMELGLLMKAASKTTKSGTPSRGNSGRARTKWEKILDLIKAVVKGRTADPD